MNTRPEAHVIPNHATGQLAVTWKPDGQGDVDVITTMDLQDSDQLWEGLTAALASYLCGTGMDDDTAVSLAGVSLRTVRNQLGQLTGVDL